MKKRTLLCLLLAGLMLSGTSCISTVALENNDILENAPVESSVAHEILDDVSVEVESAPVEYTLGDKADLKKIVEAFALGDDLHYAKKESAENLMLANIESLKQLYKLVEEKASMKDFVEVMGYPSYRPVTNMDYHAWEIAPGLDVWITRGKTSDGMVYVLSASLKFNVQEKLDLDVTFYDYLMGKCDNFTVEETPNGLIFYPKVNES